MAEVDRRTMLAAGSAAAIVGAVPARAEPARGPAVLVFDPRSSEARAEAERVRGRRLVALADDPVRTWRDELARHDGSVAGLTRWSDYLVLRGLAEERGLRIRSEERVAVAGGAMIVRWRMA